MSLKQRLHDYFYDCVYEAAGTKAGRKVLSMAAPVFRKMCPPEDVSKTPAQVLEGLGYAPHIFDNITDKKVRVLGRDLKSMLALSSMLADQSMLRRAFSKHMDAAAFFYGNDKSASTRYVLLNDSRDYKAMMSNLSCLPERFLTGLKGDGNMSQAFTLGHEMTHFTMPPTRHEDPALSVHIESTCDGLPLGAFSAAADPDIFTDTLKDLVYGRAVGPILVYMADREEKDDYIFAHATALMLMNRELREQENPGQIVIQTYKSACDLIARHLDWGSNEPRMFQVYKTAKSLVTGHETNDKLVQQVLEMFTEGMEYLAPDMVDFIMTAPENRHAHICAML